MKISDYPSISSDLKESHKLLFNYLIEPNSSDAAEELTKYSIVNDEPDYIHLMVNHVFNRSEEIGKRDEFCSPGFDRTEFSVDDFENVIPDIVDTLIAHLDDYFDVCSKVLISIVPTLEIMEVPFPGDIELDEDLIKSRPSEVKSLLKLLYKYSDKLGRYSWSMLKYEEMMELVEECI